MKTKKELMREIERLKDEIRDLKRENDTQFVELRQYREADYEKRRTHQREQQIDAIVDYRKKLTAGGFSDENVSDIIGMLMERGNIIC